MISLIPLNHALSLSFKYSKSYLDTKMDTLDDDLYRRYVYHCMWENISKCVFVERLNSTAILTSPFAATARLTTYDIF